MNILAAFVNMVYIMCMGLFGALETIHHMIEHWEFESHGEAHGHDHHHDINGGHDDLAH